MPDTVDELVTDPAWQARVDQTLAEVRRAPDAWGTCPECTTQSRCSAEQWCSKQDVEDLAGRRDEVRAALHRTWLPIYGGSVRGCLVADLLAALRAEQLGGAR